MKPNMAAGELQRSLEERGFQSRIVAIEHWRDLQQRLNADRESGSVNETVYQRYMSGLEFEPPREFGPTGSIISIAAPQPKLDVLFTVRGETLSVAVPPTYAHGVDAEVTEIISRVLLRR